MVRASQAICKIIPEDRLGLRMLIVPLGGQCAIQCSAWLVVDEVRQEIPRVSGAGVMIQC